MALSLNCITYNIHEPIVGKVVSAITKENKTEPLDVLHFRSITISQDGINRDCVVGNWNYSTYGEKEKYAFVYDGISQFECGDIVSIEPNGKINFLFKKNSLHNTILFSECCNNDCVMCSQPPVMNEDFASLLKMNEKVIELMPSNCISLGITGGEPTLQWESFLTILKRLETKLPDTLLHILSNGRIFHSIQRVMELSELDIKNILLGIPLYSDFYEIHDEIVNSPNAFNQTIHGLHNLARFHIRIEIRFVITKMNYNRIEKYARFIFKYLPFVEHIAFMGLEPTGKARTNFEDVWIEPNDFMSQLEKAVCYLNSMDMNVSIYNLPLCTIPNSIKNNYKKSISDWKNIYLGPCQRCSIKEDCGGFFESANDIQHKYLLPQIN